MRRRRWWQLILILYVLFIYSNSMKPAAVSSLESGGVLQFLQLLFYKSGINAGWITEHLIRKTAHAAEYTVLGMLLLKNARLLSWETPVKRLALVTAGIFIPFVDETIQLFTEGRSGQISDVWLDMSGVCAGVLLGAALSCLLRRRAEKKKGRTS